MESKKILIVDDDVNVVNAIKTAKYVHAAVTMSDTRIVERGFRKNSECEELCLILMKDISAGKAGVDYLSEKGKFISFPIDITLP